MEYIPVRINEKLGKEAYLNRGYLAGFIHDQNWSDLIDFWLKVAKPHLFKILTHRKRVTYQVTKIFRR